MTLKNDRLRPSSRKALTYSSLNLGEHLASTRRSVLTEVFELPSKRFPGKCNGSRGFGNIMLRLFGPV